MATEKLAEGIRLFAVDGKKLDDLRRQGHRRRSWPGTPSCTETGTNPARPSVCGESSLADAGQESALRSAERRRLACTEKIKNAARFPGRRFLFKGIRFPEARETGSAVEQALFLNLDGFLAGYGRGG